MAKWFIQTELKVCHNGPCVWGHCLILHPLRTITPMLALNSGHNGKSSHVVYSFVLLLHPSSV